MTKVIVVLDPETGDTHAFHQEAWRYDYLLDDWLADKYPARHEEWVDAIKARDPVPTDFAEYLETHQTDPIYIMFDVPYHGPEDAPA